MYVTLPLSKFSIKHYLLAYRLPGVVEYKVPQHWSDYNLADVVPPLHSRVGTVELCYQNSDLVMVYVLF